MNRKPIKLLAIATFLIASAGAAQADTLYLQGNFDFSSGDPILGNLADDGSGGAVSKDASSASAPYLYEFGNASTGSGTPAAGGFVGDLDLNGYSLNSNGSPTAITLDMGNNDLIGASGSLSLDTVNNWNIDGGGHVGIYNAAVVSLGAIDTHSYGNGSGGDVFIGESGNLVSSVRVDSIATHTIGTGSNRYAGDVEIYSATDVLIQTGGGIAGNIDTHSAKRAAAVTINHNGSFAAADILAYASSNDVWNGGNVTLEGDYSGGGASGTATIANISTYLDRTDSDTNRSSSGSVNISGYTSVLVTGSINTWNDVPGGGGAGSILIQDVAGDIAILGTMNTSKNGTVGTAGSLTLTAGGSIILGNLDNNTLGQISLTTGIDLADDYIWVKSEPVNFVDGPVANSLKGQFASLNNHIYYSDTVGSGLEGVKYLVKDDNTDTGFQFIPVSPTVAALTDDADNLTLGANLIDFLALEGLFGATGNGLDAHGNGWQYITGLTPGTAGDLVDLGGGEYVAYFSETAGMTMTNVAVPEPATMGLLLLGGLGLIGGSVRRRKA
ncbi:MAG: hypothetical protein BIFFINMI_00548 [Phycisphaerae bacterium]|nr:hypothetical protein [Phycisphaerae bacterium]